MATYFLDPFKDTKDEWGHVEGATGTICTTKTQREGGTPPESPRVEASASGKHENIEVPTLALKAEEKVLSWAIHAYCSTAGAQGIVVNTARTTKTPTVVVGVNFGPGWVKAELVEELTQAELNEKILMQAQTNAASGTAKLFAWYIKIVTNAAEGGAGPQMVMMV